MTEIVYYYDGSFDGLLSCVFDSYACRETPIAICPEAEAMPTLFAARAVQTDTGHARRVLRKVAACSPRALELLHKGFLTCLPEKELYLYRLVRKLLADGPGFLRDYSDETLHPVAAAVRRLEGEAHLLKGFVRFSDFGGVLGGEIEPKNRVLPLLRPHFCARYSGETFLIHDRTHREALLYRPRQWAILPLEELRLEDPGREEREYRRLWRRFYDTVAIQGRENPRCRRSHMPKRYWSTMTEFQEEPEEGEKFLPERK